MDILGIGDPDGPSVNRADYQSAKATPDAFEGSGSD